MMYTMYGVQFEYWTVYWTMDENDHQKYFVVGYLPSNMTVTRTSIVLNTIDEVVSHIKSRDVGICEKKLREDLIRLESSQKTG